MNLKKVLGILCFWLVSMALCTAFAVRAVLAQGLIPPPPVVSVPEPGLARLEIKLDAIERRQREQTRLLKAVYVKLFPFKMEQGAMDAPVDGD
ncbi:MAG: hypothetical protein K2X27_13495 [Candidatus Obscuribacterales bacterium]|nr:hypothetical protein [Candidatus Obscuribacterales bacterium]